VEARCGEATREWLGSEAVIEVIDRGSIGEDNPAELALVAEAKVVAVVEVNGEVLEADGRSLTVDEEETAGHPEVDDEREVIVQMQEEVLAAPTGIADRAADDRWDGLDAIKRCLEYGREFAQCYTLDGLAHDDRMEDAADRFDFG
jgi:hypothetical protein